MGNGPACCHLFLIDRKTKAIKRETVLENDDLKYFSVR